MSGHRVLYDLFQAPFLMLDPGNAKTITVDRYSAVCPIVSAAAETRTLAQPTKAGLRCIVLLSVDGGTVTLTVTGGYNNDDDTSITLDDAGDYVEFLSIMEGTNYYWRIASQEGTNIPVEAGNFDTLSIAGTAITATAAEINNAADDSLHTQAITAASTAITVDGTINRVTVTNAVNGAITLAAPSAAMMGKLLTIEFIGAGTNATTLALTNVQGGSSASSASFNAANETLVLIGGELKWTVLKEVGVTLS